MRATRTSDLLRACLALALGLCVVLAADRASAQAASTSVGSCTGSIAATIGLAAVKNPEDAAAEQERQSISLSYAPYAFGRAECECDTQDIFMRVQLSMCLPAGTQGNPTIWVGTSACSNYTTRTTTNQTQCQQYTGSITNLNSQSFNAAGGNCSTTTFFDIFVPSRALFSPNVGSCDISTASNQVFIFVGPDQTMPIATCTLPLTQQVTGPGAAVGGQAASGDSAITVTWQSPPVGSSLAADSFQVLCADEDGNPLSDVLKDNAYSTCLPSGIRRRQNMFGGTSITPVVDGGTTTTDLGVSSTSSALAAPGGPGPVPHATDDMGTDDMGTDDMGDGGVDAGGTSLTSGIKPSNSGLSAPFDTLDPRYVCSERIPVTAQDYSTRVTNLVNDKSYRFVILAIDLYGNATPSAVLEGTPRAVDDLYSRYRGAGGGAQGFCFIATAAYGDYDHPQVRVLRAFRDRILARNAAGRAFVRAYYAASPPLARYIEDSSMRRAVTRALLWPLVGVAALALQLGSLTLALLLAGGLPALLLWLRRRHRARQQLAEVLA